MSTTDCGPCAAGSIAAYYNAWQLPPGHDDPSIRFELTKNRARDSFCKAHAREFFAKLTGRDAP